MDHLRLLDLDIDRPAQRVSRAGQVLPVTGLSWKLLEVLLAHGVAVVGFDTLAAQVWAPAVVGEDAISQRVKLLRQALGDDSRRPRYIRSVRGQGYQLCALPQPLERPAIGTPRRFPRWPWPVAAGAVVLAGVLLWPHAPPAGPAQALLARADHYAGIGQAANNQRAIALYRQALQADPDSMAARRGLARALAADTCLYNGGPGPARQALALVAPARSGQPQDGATYAVRGYAHDCLGQMPQAIADYQRALEREPGDEATRASLAYLYQEQGQLARALRDNLALKAPGRVRFRDVQVARELELLGFPRVAGEQHARNFLLYPDNVFANIAWPHSLLAAGEPERARQVLAQALQRGTPHPQLLRLQAELALLAGDRPAAARAFEAASQLRPQQSLGQTLVLLHGTTPAARAGIEQRLQQVRTQQADGWPDAALEQALLLQALGQRDAAQGALQQAVDAGFRDAAWLRVTPLFAPLRSPPGIDAVLARIDADVARQRAQVLAAPWRPAELAGLSAAPAAGNR
ncbi:winged helix-turn-helix transcriptional regulator [Stenotrophomonas sp. 24(2023)]|uniref:winged helix-turn-helix transcriptional regulator n=1 Tax=Stenotrophomonas sp. 24(2023) TaxID=3068324 RepID=UPI0027DF5B19|nr:winged helix-turn-helix transcriptional regulator [Stenotrophomonas sp. 24(2023)]WMJ69921.1 winged helix-turn-helix domain-containing protein [Stenotrophomonas sp. 24(2023)]